ncbi:MAG: hypothetical protein J6W11_00065, partial [Alphaproteobacteria bacterium]|nr:hypothetical protein [Alphaproteobacteria bacterium]
AAQGEGISKEAAESFRKPDAPEKIKDFVQSNNDWLIPASFQSAAIFKDYFPSYLKLILNHNQKNPEDKLSIHDAVYWLPDPMDEKSNAHFAEFIQKNLFYQNAKHQMVHRPLNELKTIAQNWKKVEKELKKRGETADIKQFKYADVLSVCASVKYDNPQNEQFAAEAAKHYVPEYQYYEYEDIYLAGLKVPEPFDSTQKFKVGKYVGRFLPRDDVRTGFFGDYTNCCQHFGGVGRACAISTVKHPFSQLFVIEDEKGKIIAGSWAWENTENKYREVCFDNIEALGELQKRPEINEIYEQVGSYLANKENCRRVTVGLGYQDADVSKYKKTRAIALPKLYGNDGTGSYSDAKSQVLLAQNENAEPLDHTKESQRYIRNMCYLDEKTLQSVTEQCFSKSDNKPFKSDHLDGFVIEDREKGVVGHILYDKEKKEIYDMAVLPEYCTDQNASSRKLFAEMIKEVKNEGGQWHAELRDKETLRYIESMVELGAIKMEKNDVDNETRNTSKAIQLTIEPVRDEVRQAQQRVSDKVQMKHTDVLTEPTEIPSVIVSQHNNGYDGR